MTRLFFLFFIFFYQNLFAQNLSKLDLIQDLTYLNEAVINGHPINYDPNIKVNILSVIEMAKQLKTDSISQTDYARWIEKGIYNIGCVHSSIKRNSTFTNKNSIVFIPLTASIYKEKLLITSCIDNTKVGQLITSINGKSINEFIEPYKEYKASDGGTNAFAKEYFHLASSKLISTTLQNAKIYAIKTIESEFSLSGTNELFKRIQTKNYQHNLISNNTNQFYTIDNFSILRVNTFQKSDKQFFEKLFKKIKKLKTENLLIDLRQNLGGNRASAVKLTKYLADATFAYSILQPKLQTKKYLNGKGKFYFYLSKLKYNVGSIFKKHNSKYGVEFTYSYKPKKQNHFEGKLYVITDGFTASASTMVTSWLKQHTNAIFIGNQASGGYNGNNGGSFPIITLPKSKIEITFPAYRLILDKKSENRTGILPDINVQSNTDISEIIKLIQNK